MVNHFDTFHPKGFSTVNSYLFTEEPQKLIEFLKKAFFAIEGASTIEDDGIIRNLILTIGDTSFMISQASEPFLGMKTSFYLYVRDVDFIYENALKEGGKDVLAPADMDYGDRQAGIQDPAGNYWWISRRLTESEY